MELYIDEGRTSVLAVQVLRRVCGREGRDLQPKRAVRGENYNQSAQEIGA